MIDGSFILDAIGSLLGLLSSGTSVIGSAIGFVGNIVSTILRVIFG